MKLILSIIGLAVSLLVAFFMWCCIRVGSMEDPAIRNEEELEWLRNREKGDS